MDKGDGEFPLECGCPPPVPVLKTNAPSAPLPEASLPESANLGSGPTSTDTNSTAGHPGDPALSQPALSKGPETAPLPPSKPDDIQVQVESPLVFNAKSRVAAPGAQAA